MSSGASAPIIVTGLLTFMGVVVTAVLKLIRQILGSKAEGAPKMTDLWERVRKVEDDLDEERQARRDLEDRVDAEHRRASRLESTVRIIRNIFSAYVERVQTGGSTDLLPEEKSALLDTPIDETTQI